MGPQIQGPLGPRCPRAGRAELLGCSPSAGSLCRPWSGSPRLLPTLCPSSDAPQKLQMCGSVSIHVRSQCCWLEVRAWQEVWVLWDTLTHPFPDSPGLHVGLARLHPSSPAASWPFAPPSQPFDLSPVWNCTSLSVATTGQSTVRGLKPGVTGHPPPSHMGRLRREEGKSGPARVPRDLGDLSWRRSLGVKATSWACDPVCSE